MERQGLLPKVRKCATLAWCVSTTRSLGVSFNPPNVNIPTIAIIQCLDEFRWLFWNGLPLWQCISMDDGGLNSKFSHFYFLKDPLGQALCLQRGFRGLPFAPHGFSCKLLKTSPPSNSWQCNIPWGFRRCVWLSCTLDCLCRWALDSSSWLCGEWAWLVFDIVVMQSTFKAYDAERDINGLTPNQLRALKISLVCSDCILIGEMSDVSTQCIVFSLSNVYWNV